MRLLLDQQPLIPDEMIAPRAGWRRWVAVHDRQVDTLRLLPEKLRLEHGVRGRMLREHDDAGRVPIDAVHHERPTTLMRPEMAIEVFNDGRRLPSRQRDGEQP